jgi:hypothetical protein
MLTLFNKNPLNSLETHYSLIKNPKGSGRAAPQAAALDTR